MRLFGRRKPLHERLLEEAGLAESPSAAAAPVTVHVPAPAIHGSAREREWDAVATVDAPGVAGQEVVFDVLPDRTLLVDSEEGDEPLAPLADAVERELRPPYRARAVRQAGELWAIAARRIEVVRLQDGPGDALELSVRGGERQLVVDGVRAFGGMPELEALGDAHHREYVVRAERLDEDWWEVRVDPL